MYFEFYPHVKIYYLGVLTYSYESLVNYKLLQQL